MLEKVFLIREKGSSIGRELLGGIVTFMTMAYIISTQPFFMSKLAPSWVQHGDATFYSIMVGTCLVSAAATLMMALFANYPVALAPGMGENILFAVIIGSAICAPPQAIGVIFISGLIFLLLSILGVQKKIMTLISASLKSSIAVAIGCFIALLGVLSAFAYPADFNLLKWHFDFAFDQTIFMIFSINLAIIVVLYILRIPGAIFIGLILAVVVSSFFGAVNVTGIVGPVPSLDPTFLQIDIIGALTPALIPYILLFLFLDVFDTLGTLIGVTQKAGFIKEDGTLPRLKGAMVADAAGTVGGSFFGISTVTSFIESSAGVAAGARTGLAGIVTALLFLVSIFFTPLWSGLSAHFIIGPALILVGFLMMTEAKKIEWGDWTEAVPALLTILGMVALKSIHDGMAAGFISYPVCKLLAGRGKDLTWLSWFLAVVCIVMEVFLITAM